MKGDTTRSTFNSKKHYNGVRMQQGRVQLDADWNEQIDIIGHRVETETKDIVGRCGAPMHDPGFHVVGKFDDLSPEEKAYAANNPAPPVGQGDLLISAGRSYVDGILCENERIITYSAQSNTDNPGAVAITQEGTYLAYLDVWSRHLTAIEDQQIREVALDGPDTATRSKTVWQVKLHRLGDADLKINGIPVHCSNVFASWNTEIAAGTGKLAAKAATSAPSNKPCIVDPGAGYRRLENQHYRVEVHQAGPLGTATFKWSRDNGSIVTKWESKDTDKLTVSSIGRDKMLGFASEQWVELTDDTLELSGKPGTLVQLVKAEGQILTINPATATGPVEIANFPRNPKVRRWDMASPLKPANSNWIELEDGVQVRFVTGAFKTGDYWMIPARTATADIEWPKDATKLDGAAEELPHGILHHHCRLGLLEFKANQWKQLSDCRDLFPPLTELTSFFYVGGDGQEVMPDLTQPNSFTPELPQPLEVGVTNGQWPVSGATVKFEITKGPGQLVGVDAQGNVATNASGIAACKWKLGTPPNAPLSQQVTATLRNDKGDVVGVPIHFTANLSVAEQVAYNPKQCTSLQGKKNVQQAIETISTLTSLFEVSGDNQSIGASEQLQPLVVIAASKCGPVAGLAVQFKVISGGGAVRPKGAPPQAGVPNLTVNTNAQGLAECEWTLGPAQGSQVVEAVLAAGPNNPLAPPTTVRFTAQRRGAVEDPGFHVTGLMLLSGLTVLRNNMDVTPNLLAQGVAVDCDNIVDPATVATPAPPTGTQFPINCPVFFIAVEIPYPVTSSDRSFVDMTASIGWERIVLAGDVSASENQIIWGPISEISTWFARLFSQFRSLALPERVLARLTIKGSFIRALNRPDLFLDGDTFGVAAGVNAHDLQLPSGDGKRGGDFEMWFWVVPEPPKSGEKSPTEKSPIEKIQIEKTTDKTGAAEKIPDVKQIEKATDKIKERETKSPKETEGGLGLRAADSSSHPAPVNSAGSTVVTETAGRAFIRPEERPAVDANPFLDGSGGTN